MTKEEAEATAILNIRLTKEQTLTEEFIRSGENATAAQIREVAKAKRSTANALEVLASFTVTASKRR